MSDCLVIQSHAGPYTAFFDEDAPSRLAKEVGPELHVIVDRRVAELHRRELSGVLAGPSVLLLDATERNKSLERLPEYVGHLLVHGVRRNHRLLAIGGGVIQDITCFLAATMLRGMDWIFLPTTVLAQADSCIGSKSSINCGDAKNILGTFTPPREVWVSSRMLDSLEERDVRSGVGEMLKIHAIEGSASFDRIARDYEALFRERDTMLAYIRRSLAIKKPYCEIDEFDRRERNLLNFGHTFGHAIEAATEFAVPHGIGVTIGMDLALEVSRAYGLTGDATVTRMRPVLRRNAGEFLEIPVPLDRFFDALGRDKKNVGTGSVTVILPTGEGKIERVVRPIDDEFRSCCAAYFAAARA